jgi:hypothetical protein
MVLAGVAAEETVWAGFEREWKELLTSRMPVAPYLHMREVSRGFGVFANESGWDAARRQQLVTDCLLYGQSLDKLCFRSFICTIDMKCYRELKAEGSLRTSAFEMCNHWSPRLIFRWYLENFAQWKLPELHYFFDQNEKFKGPFENSVRRCKKMKSYLANPWHLVGQIENVDMRLNAPLQLADMIAWAHHRRLTPHRANLEWSSLHMVTDAVLPSTRKDLDADHLKFIASFEKFGTIVPDYFGSCVVQSTGPSSASRDKVI